MTPGPRNAITDVKGLKLGQAHDAELKSGVTVLAGDAPFVAGVHVMGGAPGSRETDLLSPDRFVQEVDALVLSGGSAFGLDAASGVADALRAAGRGFAVGDQRVPIVPGAILFDLTNGGDKSWTRNPYYDLGQQAFAALGDQVDLGSAGAGFGALTHGLKGGLGTASLCLDSGHTVAAVVAVNALGSVTVDDTPHFRAALSEINGEFGGLGPAPSANPSAMPGLAKSPGEATTIAIVATDAALTQAQATRMAVAAHDGMARAIWPSHSLFDGDLVFAAATGARPLADPLSDQFELGHAAALCLERAIARGVCCASPSPGDLLPCWQSAFS